MNKSIVFSGLVVAAVLVGCGRVPGTNTQRLAANSAQVGAAAQPAVTALVALAPTRDSKTSGTLTLVSEQGVVSINGQVGGLEPGSKHGFHVHEKGNCSARDASSAGGVFTPETVATKDDSRLDAHQLGEVMNIEADDKGTAQVRIRLVGVSLKDGGPGDLKGKSIIVHAQPDDPAAQPASDSGDRSACGVIF
ncbi:MAG TPA: superoxide dismutase family protein [Steroidobacteraceae bacterium]|nr:superoxide dismutase family protein [Steroidobacteraceae bacterium]